MTASAPSPRVRTTRAVGPAAARRLVAYLEGFWPSRRSHAFDELCR